MWRERWRGGEGTDAACVSRLEALWCTSPAAGLRGRTIWPVMRGSGATSTDEPVARRRSMREEGRGVRRFARDGSAHTQQRREDVDQHSSGVWDSKLAGHERYVRTSQTKTNQTKSRATTRSSTIDHACLCAPTRPPRQLPRLELVDQRKSACPRPRWNSQYDGPDGMADPRACTTASTDRRGSHQ